MYYNTKLIMKGEVWRLATNFFFFGQLGAGTVDKMRQAEGTLVAHFRWCTARSRRGGRRSHVHQAAPSSAQELFL